MNHDKIQEIEEKRNHLNALTHEMAQTDDIVMGLLSTSAVLSVLTVMYIYFFS